MKTINDFKLINGVAVLEGVSYAEEAKVVEEYLKNNNNIEKASVIAKDGRRFELKDGRLVLSSEPTFLNPYYTIEKKHEEEVVSKLVESNLEARINRLDKLIDEVLGLLKSYITGDR